MEMIPHRTKPRDGGEIGTSIADGEDETRPEA